MWISDNLQLDGRNFFRECCRGTNGLWYVWVYVVGSRKDAKNYRCSIKITSSDKSEELTYKGRVISVDFSKEEVAALGCGLVFPDATAKLFWDDRKIHYSVTVEEKNHQHHHQHRNHHRSSSSSSSSNSKSKSKATNIEEKEEEEKDEEVEEESNNEDCSRNKEDSKAPQVPLGKDDKKRKKSVKESSC